MKKIIYILTLTIIIQANGLAQVGINTNGAAPATSAMLDVSSSNKGVLLPRLTSAERKAISNPSMGLLVFDIDRQTICMFDGQEWRPLIFGNESAPYTVQRTGSNSKQQGHFGKAVAMHGNYAVIGAPRDSISGCAYVFFKENGVWTQQAKIAASINTPNAEFGASVDIYNDIIVVGAPGMKVGDQSEQGRAYVFKRYGNVWLQQVGLQANNGKAEDWFGTSVTIYDNTMIVGAPGRDHTNFTNPGAVFVYRNTSGTWEHRIVVNPWDQYDLDNSYFGTSLDLYENMLVVGAPKGGNYGGAAYTYFNGDALGYLWTNGQKLSPDYGNFGGSNFGASVALNSTNMIIGAPKFTFYDAGAEGGIWYVYKRWNNGTIWSKVGTGGSEKQYAREGSSVAVDGDTFYIGSPGWIDDDGGLSGKGRVLIYKNNTIRYLYNIEKDIKSGFGTSVAADNGQFVIGAPAIAGGILGTANFGVQQ